MAAEDGQVHHLKPITIRTLAGAAAQQCLDALRPDDKVVRIVRRAGVLLPLFLECCAYEQTRLRSEVTR